MGISDEMKAKDLVEVIYPVFDGNIYCLDLETGKTTRDPIKVGYRFQGNRLRSTRAAIRCSTPARV